MVPALAIPMQISLARVTARMKTSGTRPSSRTKVVGGDDHRGIVREGIVTAQAACWRFECGVAEEHEENQLLQVYRFPPEIIHQAVWLYFRN